MLNYPNVVLIGIGNKARNGKDTVANILKELVDNVKIIHWADGVYEECENTNSEYPLILKEFSTKTKSYYTVLANKETGERFAISSLMDPFLHKIFTDRNIDEYKGMVGKDPEILQFWGTNYRRTYCDINYWTSLTMKKARTVANEMKDGLILIPDTRFVNEADTLKMNDGYYVKVIRTNIDGTQYITKDRDPLHSSEIDLDNYHADVVLKAYDVPELQIQVEMLYDDFILPKLQTVST